MKKIVVILLALLALTLAVAPAALAETDCEAKICKLATQNENVTQAECIVYKRIAVVAIRTEKMVTKSQYDQFTEKLCNDVKQQFEIDRVFVTRNPKIMKEIQTLSQLPTEQRDKAIEKIVQEAMKHRPLHKMELPQMTHGK